MAEKTKSSNGILNSLALVLIVVSVLLVISFQVQQVADIVAPEATQTAVPVYSGDGGSGLTIKDEDILPTDTPTPTQDVSHQE